MERFPNRQPFTLSGPWRFKIRSLGVLLGTAIKITLRRLLRGPLLPGWSWILEVGTVFGRDQFRYAFDMPDIGDSRAYLDALVPYASALEQMQLRHVKDPVEGTWFSPRETKRELAVLFLHGGGYCYDPKSALGLTALVASACEARTFSLDYRLAPEHSFPAQLEDAIAAYEWLLELTERSDRIVVAGASSGGHLGLSLLLTLRERQQPLPALAIGLSPWIDLANSGESMIRNEKYDFIDRLMCDRSTGWFLGEEPADSMAISLLQADLRRLPPIYLQAGGAEIFSDMIEAFAERANSQGAEVTLDVWESMNHAFQAYGEQLAESREALKRIREVVVYYSELSSQTSRPAGGS